MKIFISSVIAGFEQFREAAVEAIESLGHEPIRAEDFCASPSSPQEVCLAGVRRSNAVLLLIGERYGYNQKSGLSATHEEYREARERGPVFVFIQQGVGRESEQQGFLREVQSWESGHYTADFKSPQDLRKAVTATLHRHEVSTAAGGADPQEMLRRAQEVVPSERTYGNGLFIAVAGGPQQQVLRPSELEGKELQQRIIQEALFGDNSVLTHKRGTDVRLDEHRLAIMQDDASLHLDPSGSILLRMPIREEDESSGFSLPVIIQEDVEKRVERGLRFLGWLLDHVDQPRRLSDVVPVVGLVGAGYLGWQTRAENARSRNSVEMGSGGDRVVVHLTPPARKRAALTQDASRLAEDLTVLLRREVKR